ncbi:MAG: hypothetical protein OCU20_05655 [Methanophagales archaeon]|nr:hypothetical protein [Methanophagales archaeon]MCW3140521.1 hypothetical protein [Methanophagales archaeon]MCW7070675.1 hypothetical protein [Methanophagales archaeon]MCW7073355.1 hypothetical protein [Methanophagales archaeon]
MPEGGSLEIKREENKEEGDIEMSMRIPAKAYPRRAGRESSSLFSLRNLVVLI